MSSSTRWLVLAAGAVAVVVVAAVVVSAVGGQARTYPRGSPERTVQQYLQAVADRDATRAFSFLSANAAVRCADYRQAITNRGRQSVRATLEETTLREGVARVRVTLIETYGDTPFGSSESTRSTLFELGQEAGVWRILLDPWPLSCPVRAPGVPLR